MGEQINLALSPGFCKGQSYTQRQGSGENSCINLPFCDCVYLCLTPLRTLPPHNNQAVLFLHGFAAQSGRITPGYYDGAGRACGQASLPQKLVCNVWMLSMPTHHKIGMEMHDLHPKCLLDHPLPWFFPASCASRTELSHKYSQRPADLCSCTGPLSACRWDL